MLFVSEQGEFLKKVKNTKNPCKLLPTGVYFGCPEGLGRIWWFLIIPYLDIIY